MGSQHRDLPATEFRFILHIVMNQKRVVVQLERSRTQSRLICSSTRGSGGGEQDCWPETLSLAERVIGKQVVERTIPGGPIDFEEIAELV